VHRGEHRDRLGHVVDAFEREGGVELPGPVGQVARVGQMELDPSATPACRALARARSTESASTSKPSTRACGYAWASAIVDQPPPAPTSAMRAPGTRGTASRPVTPASASGSARWNQGGAEQPVGELFGRVTHPWHASQEGLGTTRISAHMSWAGI
jgi:hypothetical protein